VRWKHVTWQSCISWAFYYWILQLQLSMSLSNNSNIHLIIMHSHFFQSVTKCQTALGISVIHNTYFGNNIAINSEQLMTSTSLSKYTVRLRKQSCHHISQRVLKCLHELIKFINVIYYWLKKWRNMKVREGYSCSMALHTLYNWAIILLISTI
jgi:hypothetical protein